MKKIITLLVTLAALGAAFAAPDSRAQDSQQAHARSTHRVESHEARPLLEADDPEIEAIEIQAEIEHFCEVRKDFESRMGDIDLRVDYLVYGEITYRVATESDFGVVVEWSVDSRSYAQTGEKKLPIEHAEGPWGNHNHSGSGWTSVYNLEEASRDRTFYPSGLFVGGERRAKELSAKLWVHAKVAKNVTYGKVKNVAAIALGEKAFESEDGKLTVKVHAKREGLLTLHFLGVKESLRDLRFSSEPEAWIGIVENTRPIQNGWEVEFKMADELPEEYFLHFAALEDVGYCTFLIKTEKFQLP
ncbi:MAG: hypothetical protein KDB07_05780 [Planctomycetes bacterium]|nr:hypothetical protein [Planctomycetota bacterium]